MQRACVSPVAGLPPVRGARTHYRAARVVPSQPTPQTNDAVESLNALVVALNDRLRALEGHLGSINTPLQASVYDFVMAAQAATKNVKRDSTNAAAFER